MLVVLSVCLLGLALATLTEPRPARPSPGSSLSVATHFVNGGNDSLPSILSGESPLVVVMEVSARSAVPSEAEIVISAKEVFSGARCQHRRPLGHAISSGDSHRTRLIVAPEELPLTPGCWLVLTDIEDKGKGLAGHDIGCVEAYARRAGESALHARASYNLARADFALDREYGVYYGGYATVLPPTGNPYSADNFERLCREFARDDITYPESEHDGGLGFLYGAIVFHALGETDRARYCEQVLRTVAHVVLDLMTKEDGSVVPIAGRERQRAHSESGPAHQGAFCLKLLSQAYFYFRFGAGADLAYARELLTRLHPIYGYLVAHPLGVGASARPGTGESCYCYDGRVTGGVAWYSLAYQAEHGRYPDEVIKLCRGVTEQARHLLANNGWYDTGCLIEGACHTWCGNMNLLNGLLPTLRIARDLAAAGDTDYGGVGRFIIPHLERACEDAFRFLTYTKGAVTGEPAFVPTDTSQWAAGNLYELCGEYLRQVKPDAGVAKLRDHMPLEAGTHIADAWHRNSAAAMALQHCPEYRDVSPAPVLPWDKGAF